MKYGIKFTDYSQIHHFHTTAMKKLALLFVMAFVPTNYNTFYFNYDQTLGPDTESGAYEIVVIDSRGEPYLVRISSDREVSFQSLVLGY